MQKPESFFWFRSLLSTAAATAAPTAAAAVQLIRSKSALDQILRFHGAR